VRRGNKKTQSKTPGYKGKKKIIPWTGMLVGTGERKGGTTGKKPTNLILLVLGKDQRGPANQGQIKEKPGPTQKRGVPAQTDSGGVRGVSERGVKCGKKFGILSGLQRKPSPTEGNEVGIKQLKFARFGGGGKKVKVLSRNQEKFPSPK